MSMDLEKAEAVVNMLGEKRAACIKHGTDLQDERASVALAVYTGDEAARKRLGEIETALTTHTSSLASIDAALRAASERVVAAQQATAREIVKQHTKQLLEQISAIQEMAAPLDVCLGRTVAGQFGGFRYDAGPADPPLLDVVHRDRSGTCSVLAQ
jgi:hypothetical protein